MSRTEDDYLETDLLPSAIKDLTIQVARKDRKIVEECLRVFGAANINGLFLRDLRPYVESLHAALDETPPTAIEWANLKFANPAVERHLQSMRKVERQWNAARERTGAQKASTQL